MKIVNILLAFLIIGCNVPHYVDFFPYHDDGTLKSKVVLLPVEASEERYLQLAEYMDSALRWMAMDQGKLYLYSTEEISGVINHHYQVFKSNDPLQKGNCFHPADYLVEAEVIQNDVIPYSLDLHSHFVVLSSIKNRWVRIVKVRLRICDIRLSKVVLYEIIEKNQLVPTHHEHSYHTEQIYELLAEQISSRIHEVVGGYK